ncbi:hypothetical protein U9M48_020735 [Paspalum notatum var. saurae]|uniref:FAR1 domain-containing protein n=1 Tax=Paspalum notatum var. saurae TaxID=547442 RepID=A0AAQ3TFQ8_PASNO
MDSNGGALSTPHALSWHCKAMIRLLRTADAGWYIAELHREHNHGLSIGCCEKREWRSHKRIDPYTFDVIRHLRQNNVSATKVRCIIESMLVV